MTKGSIVDLYETQISQLRTKADTARNVQVVHDLTKAGLKEGYPTILERFRFTDGAVSSNHFLKSILAQYKRRQWDRNAVDLRLILPVRDRNMVILEELSNELVPGYQEREILVKRFIFRASGCLFVYTSSVPDTIH